MSIAQNLHILFLMFANSFEIPQFVDITKDAIPGEPVVGSFISIGDYNNDGLEDILIDNRLMKNISYLGIHFYDATEEAGLGEAKGHGSFIDINNDSCVDIIFYGVNQKIQIYRNLCNGTFKKVEDISGLEGCNNTEAISFIYQKSERRGLLYCANYEFEDNYFRDYLYGIDEDFLFLDLLYLIKSESINIKNPSRCAVSGDINNDGLTDLYVCNYRLFPNYLYLQRDDGEFTNEGFNLNAHAFVYDEKGIIAGSHTIGATFSDLDNDGVFELIVANLAHNDYVRGNYNIKSQILRYSQKDRRFVDIRPLSGIEIDPVGSNIKGIYKDELFSAVVSADFNNDGNNDILFSQVYDNSYSYSRFFTAVNNRPYFVETTFASGAIYYDSLGATYLDIDGDGCLDIVSAGKKRGEKNRHLIIFQNACDYSNKYFDVRLSGRSSNPIPYNSKVWAFISDGENQRVLLRQIEFSSSGFGQQNSATLHFGLCKSCSVDMIFIEWTSGVIQIRGISEYNKTYYFVEPDIELPRINDIIEYDRDRLFIDYTCNEDTPCHLFFANSCEMRFEEIEGNIIERERLRGDDFCRDFVILIDNSGIGVRRLLEAY